MSAKTESKKASEKGIGITIFVAVLAVVVCGVWAGYDYYSTWDSEDWGNPGIRGDFIGGHLAAGAALASAVLMFGALVLQSRELRLQREELQESREVAKEQAKHLEKQANLLHRQNIMNQERDDLHLILTLADKINAVKPSSSILRELESEEPRLVSRAKQVQKRAQEKSLTSINVAYRRLDNMIDFAKKTDDPLVYERALAAKDLFDSLVSWWDEDARKELRRLARDGKLDAATPERSPEE